jgi:hypothetical protein
MLPVNTPRPKTLMPGWVRPSLMIEDIRCSSGLHEFPATQQTDVSDNPPSSSGSKNGRGSVALTAVAEAEGRTAGVLLDHAVLDPFFTKPGFTKGEIFSEFSEPGQIGKALQAGPNTRSAARN